MARSVVLNSEGIFIGMPGYDPLTSDARNVLFSSKAAQQRIYDRGVIALNQIENDDRYRRGNVTFGKTFQRPPIVLVAGIIDENQADSTLCTPFGLMGYGSVTYQVEPYYSLEISTTGFLMRTWGAGFFAQHSGAYSWMYAVLENTL